MRRFNIIEKQICLSVDAIAKAIVDVTHAEFKNVLNTIWQGLKRNRKTGSDSWQHHSDTSDARRKWIVYESLPTNTRTKVQLYYKDVQSACYAEMLIERVNSKVQQEDFSYFLNHGNFTTEQAIGLAEACGWMRLLQDNLGKEYFKGKLSYYENVAKVIHQRNLYGLRVKNGRVLQRKVKAFQKDGKNSLVHKGFDNNNGQKLSELGLQRIIMLYASPLKPTYLAVTKLYNREARERGWQELTSERIRQILSLPKYKQLIFASRHGEGEFRNRLERTIKRRKPSFPDALWSVDGFTIQLRYMNKYGQVKSDLYAIGVMDVFSDAVIGYAIGTTETSTLVQAALRDACRKTGMLPYQMQYDNSSANVSGEVKDLMPRLARVHFPCQPYNGKSKPIENLIGRLEGHNMRYLPNFKGGNITSTSLDRKANPDFLAAQTKHRFLPNKEAVIAQFKLVIETHNHTKGKDDKTPLERYNTPHSKRREMDYLTQVEAFWVERKRQVRYTKDGLTIEVNKTRYTYEVESKRGIEDAAFRRKYLGDKFTIKYDPEDLSMVILYMDGKYIEMAHQKYEAPMAKADFQEGEGQIIIEALEAKKAERSAFRTELETIRASMNEEGFEELSHELLNKDAYNRMEQDMLDELLEATAQFQTPFKRRKKRKTKTLYEADEGNMEKLEI